MVTYPAELRENYEEDEWDYISLKVIAEEGEMPADVKGMSGGGIYIQISCFARSHRMSLGRSPGHRRLMPQTHRAWRLNPLC